MSQNTFILPKKDQASPLAKLIYSESYSDEAATSKCPKCKVQRIARTCAQGRKPNGNPCTIAFAFCPSCLRVKATTKHQERILALVTDIRPLDQIVSKEAVTR